MALVCWATVGVLNGQITDTLPARSTPPPASLIVAISAAHVMAASPHEPTGGVAGAARAVTVLLPKEIQHVGTPALAPVLEAVIGVDVRSRGPLGVQSDLSIRGGTFEQAALYVDGIRWSAPQTAHHLMNVPLEPYLLSGLEVVRGGTGAFAGVGAFAGSVHLKIAPNPRHPFAQVDFEAGSYGWRRAAMTAAWKTPAISHRAAVSHSTSDGYTENTDAMITRATWIGDWSGERDGRWRALVGLEEKAFGAQSFYTAAYPNQFESTGSAVGQVTWRRFAAWQSFVGAYARYHRDRFELYREGPAWYAETPDGFYVRDAWEGQPADTAAAWYSGPNRHRSLGTGITARSTNIHGSGTFTLGADTRLEAVRSNVLGVLLDSASVFPLGAHRVNVDGFASESWGSADGLFSATVTLGANLNSQFGARLLPAVDAVQRFRLGQPKGARAQPWAVFASAGRSVRHPSYTDLYYQGGAFGRADLRPEVADQIEAGIRYRQHRVDHPQLAPPRLLGTVGAEATAWLRRGSDLIDWVLLPESQAFQAANLTSTVHRGLELAADYHPGPSEARRIQSLRIAYAATTARLDSGEYVSSYALDIVRRKADAVAGFLLPGRVLLEVRATHQARNGSYVDAAGNRFDYAPFTWLGVGASRWFAEGQIQAFVRADNLLDATYVDFGNVVQPGRWWRMGLTWQHRPARP